jgi:hypothetical protein
MRAIRFIGLLLFVVLTFAMPSVSSAQIAVGISVRVAPPPIPVYAQPVCPGDGFIWTPGYWSYADGDYFWVPGTWVRAPFVGGLWTPGYWGWGGGVYLWHAGYWGPHVGFYGGVNYGFGYGGVGFFGGEWRGGVFAYNRSVTNVNVTVIHNTYNRTVNNTNVSRTSFNGGTGGTTAQPNAAERAAANERHTSATPQQTQHEHAASTNKAQFASVNHGAPGVAASPKAGAMSSNGVVGARGSGAGVRSGNTAHGGGGTGKVAAAGANPGSNPRAPRNMNTAAPNRNGSGTPTRTAQPNRGAPTKPQQNPPQQKGRGGRGEPAPKQHQ